MNYNQLHKFYRGVDLHARSMFTHILDHKGKSSFKRSSHFARTSSSAASGPLKALWCRSQARDAVARTIPALRACRSIDSDRIE